MIGRAVAAGTVVAMLLLAGCGDDGSDPDPGAPGAKTEVDGGETGTDTGTSSTTAVAGGGTTGGSAGGATQGNQIPPGDTTQQTAQDSS